ncbi:MAG: hypothetical protein JWR61_5573 [Ferruginibacter sp.]|uniref:hypothetical protein n=1 Tax=Ferruginibacter sp. TaxID=1940288 RepID=UPI002657B129|nr:hypothetical protein [Ferruginibacter sp.]MDB5280618.1 hypothetical protein [Ferruginibacter sp.]
MTTNQVTSYVPVDNKSMKALVTEVKETIATNVDMTGKTSLKVVDLWNIARNKKSASRTFAYRRNTIRFI